VVLQVTKLTFLAFIKYLVSTHCAIKLHVKYEEYEEHEIAFFFFLQKEIDTRMDSNRLQGVVDRTPLLFVPAKHKKVLSFEFRNIPSSSFFESQDKFHTSLRLQLPETGRCLSTHPISQAQSPSPLFITRQRLLAMQNTRGVPFCVTFYCLRRRLDETFFGDMLGLVTVPPPLLHAL
jgi:hypothetical protein